MKALQVADPHRENRHQGGGLEVVSCLVSLLCLPGLYHVRSLCFPLLPSLGIGAEFQILKLPISSKFLSPLLVSLSSFLCVSPELFLFFFQSPLFFAAACLLRSASPQNSLSSSFLSPVCASYVVSSLRSLLILCISPSRQLVVSCLHLAGFLCTDPSHLDLPSTLRLLSHLLQDASVSSFVHKDYSSSLTNSSDQDAIHIGAIVDTMQAPAPVTGRVQVDPGEWARQHLSQLFLVIKIKQYTTRRLASPPARILASPPASILIVYYLVDWLIDC